MGPGLRQEPDADGRPPAGRPAHSSLAPVPAQPGAVVGQAKLAADEVSFFYGNFRALERISVQLPERQITAIIGPSGCGKSTLLRIFNRLNELIPGTRLDGRVTLDGDDIYAAGVDTIALRQRVGMLFQRPNPFPMSIHDNVAYGPRILGWSKAETEEAVVTSLKAAALWDDVADRMTRSALALSGGQQQRLCIARVLAVRPEVILMDEPCSALDPIATLRIEELMQELKERYTIVIVTHNMQQASRVSGWTAFMMMNERRAGELVEFGPTPDIFNRPRDRRTEDYITGRFG